MCYSKWVKCRTYTNWFWIRSNRRRRMIPSRKIGWFVGRNPLTKLHTLLPLLDILILYQFKVDTTSSSKRSNTSFQLFCSSSSSSISQSSIKNVAIIHVRSCKQSQGILLTAGRLCKPTHSTKYISPCIIICAIITLYKLLVLCCGLMSVVFCFHLVLYSILDESVEDNYISPIRCPFLPLLLTMSFQISLLVQ